MNMTITRMIAKICTQYSYDKKYHPTFDKKEKRQFEIELKICRASIKIEGKIEMLENSFR